MTPTPSADRTIAIIIGILLLTHSIMLGLGILIGWLWDSLQNCARLLL